MYWFEKVSFLSAMLLEFLPLDLALWFLPSFCSSPSSVFGFCSFLLPRERWVVSPSWFSWPSGFLRFLFLFLREEGSACYSSLWFCVFSCWTALAPDCERGALTSTFLPLPLTRNSTDLLLALGWRDWVCLSMFSLSRPPFRESSYFYGAKHASPILEVACLSPLTVCKGSTSTSSRSTEPWSSLWLTSKEDYSCWWWVVSF